MSKIRRVGTKTNKDSSLIREQSNFMKRWDVKFDNNNFLFFRNRIITAITSQCPSNYLMSIMEKTLFYKLGMVYVQKEYSSYSFKFTDTQIYKHLLTLKMDDPLHQVAFLWCIENMLNMDFWDDKILFATKVAESLVLSGINAQLCKSGCTYMFYPTGAELLDIKVVNDTLNWLEQYPDTREKFNDSLIMFQKHMDTRHIIDNLRLSFELFLKRYNNNSKSLENQKDIVGKYLKEQGVSKEIRDMYFVLFSHYTSYNNENVKHDDTCLDIEIEYLIYLTGTFIRFLIQVKAKEAKPNE